MYYGNIMLARQLFSNDLVAWSPSFRLETVPTAELIPGKDLQWLGRHHQLTCSGTSALYHVARALGLKSGDELMVPAYHCGKEVGPFRHLGVKPVFYRIDANLAPQIRHIEMLINSQTKAILVTHFFGFPAPLDALKSLCRNRGIRLIEDCAHALFGRGPVGPLGVSGDAAVFSPRKFLPIPDGGIAVLNASNISFPERPTPPTEILTAARVLHLWHKSLKLNAPLSRRLPQRSVFAAAWPLLWSASGLTKSLAKVTRQWDSGLRPFNPPLRALSQGMSPHSRKFLEQRTDPHAIVRARRHNYEQLLAAAQISDGVEPLFDSLPTGVNPLCFPVRCRAPRQAAEAVRRRGVEASVWWSRVNSDVNWHDFPIERGLKSGVLVFPVHQSLTQKAVRRIVMSIRDLRL